MRLRHQAATPPANPQDCVLGIASTLDCNPRYVYLNPYEGAKMAVAEAARNLSCVGAEPLAVTDNLNFGSPEKPIGYWQLANACKGLAEGCEVFSTPVTGGNVSLYNETLDSEGKPQPSYPTPVVGMVGVLTDVRQACGQSWQETGDVIYLLGMGSGLTGSDSETIESFVTLGGSEYLATVHHQVAGKPPHVNVELEKQVQAVCRDGIAQGWIRSAHDSSDGGLAIALAESCIGGNRGAVIELAIASSASQRWDRVLFGEGGARIIVSVHPDHGAAWEAYISQHLGPHWEKLGTVGDSHQPLQITTKDGVGLVNVRVSAMADRWSTAIERRMAQ